MISNVERSILAAGVDDWVSLGEVASIVQGELEGNDPGDVQVLVALKHLVVEKLVELGDVAMGGFSAWDAPLDVTMVRVEELLRDSRDVRRYGAWVSNTPEGDRVAAGSLSS